MEEKELTEAIAALTTGMKAITDKITQLESKQNGGGDSSKTDAPLTLDAIIQAMNDNTKKSNGQVYDTLFAKEVDSVVAQFPAFGDYLKSTDDYGEVILDKIKGIEDYGQRMATLNKVLKTFSGASQGGSDPDMRFSKEMAARVEEDEKKTNEIKDEFLKGKSTPEEFTQKFFGSLKERMNFLQQGK